MQVRLLSISLNSFVQSLTKSLILFQSLTDGKAKPASSFLNQCSIVVFSISVFSTKSFNVVFSLKNLTKSFWFGKLSLTSINLFPLLECKPCL